MFKQKNEPRIKTKVLEVKSRAIIGKSEMEKVTERLTSQGWELSRQRKVPNKERYTLEFTYEMSPEELAKQKRNEMIRNAIIGVFIFLCCGVSYFQGAAINRQNDAATATSNVLTETESVFATQTATLWTATSTLIPSPTPTMTFTPSITPSPTITTTTTPSATSRPTDLPSGQNYYVIGQVANVRNCAETSCDLVIQLFYGDVMEILDTNVEGEDVLSGTRWMQGVYNGQLVYIHSDLVSESLPTPVPTSRPQPNNTGNSANTSSSNTSNTSGSGTTNTRRPENCADAVAMGLTAQQAGQWSHLDRDNDGVACYGD